MTTPNEYSMEIRCEADMEAFLADLVTMLEAKEETTISILIPHPQWIDMIFDIIEGNEQYQIARGEEPFLDIVFGCEADDVEDEDPMRDLEELMRELRDILDTEEEGTDNEED